MLKLLKIPRMWSSHRRSFLSDRFSRKIAHRKPVPDIFADQFVFVERIIFSFVFSDCQFSHICIFIFIWLSLCRCVFEWIYQRIRKRNYYVPRAFLHGAGTRQIWSWAGTHEGDHSETNVRRSRPMMQWAYTGRRSQYALSLPFAFSLLRPAASLALWFPLSRLLRSALPRCILSSVARKENK